MKIKTIVILAFSFLAIITCIEYKSMKISHANQKKKDMEINSILLGYCTCDSCNCVSGVAILKNRLSRINRISFYTLDNGRKINLDDQLIFTKKSIDNLEITLNEYYNNTSVVLCDSDSCYEHCYLNEEYYYFLSLPDSLKHCYFNVTWDDYSK